MRVIAVLLFLAIVIPGLHYSGVMTIDFLKSSETPVSWGPQKVSDFTLKNLKGQNVSLSDFKGKVVLLNFWASWCGPCIKEFPGLLQLTETFHKDVVFLAVSTDENQTLIETFLKRFESTHQQQMNLSSFQVVWDEHQTVSGQQFNVLKYPETFILDRQHQIVKKVVGDTDWLSEEMLAFLSRLVKKSKNSVTH